MRAKESGLIPYVSPRQNKPPPYPHKDEEKQSKHMPERKVPLLELGDRGSPEPQFEERFLDMPNVSPGRNEKCTGPLPVNKPKHPQRRHFYDDVGRKLPSPEPSRDDVRQDQYAPVQEKERKDRDIDRIPEPPEVARAPEPFKEREGRGMDRGPRPSKGDRNLRLSKDDSFIKDAKEKYQWYNERHLSPPLEVRRSRSLSPPAMTLEELHKELEAKRKELQVDMVALDKCNLLRILYIM